MTSTQALLPNTLEEFQDGQSLGELHRQSLDDFHRQSSGDLQSGQSLDLLQEAGQSLGKLGGSGDTDVQLLEEEYEAETELDEDPDDISDTRTKLGKVPGSVGTDFGQNPPIFKPNAGAQWEVVQPSNSPQDELYLDDVDGFMHQTNSLDPNDFEDVTVDELQKHVAEQIAEFEHTWYLEQSQALEERNRISGEIPRNFLETDLEEEQRLEKRREDFLEELRKQSEATADHREGAGMPTSNFGGEAAFRSANLPANNVTSVGRSVQVNFLGHSYRFWVLLSLPISIAMLC